MYSYLFNLLNTDNDPTSILYVDSYCVFYYYSGIKYINVINEMALSLSNKLRNFFICKNDFEIKG